MKLRIIITGCMVGMASLAFAQVEYDDMYFNSTDRSKLNQLKASEQSYALSSKGNKKSNLLNDEYNNPTDSYSARNINPEYTSRSNAQAAQQDEQDYFVSNYRNNPVNNYSNFNNNFNNWYNNPWYRNSWFGPSMNMWNSPYYGGFNSWGNNWGNSWYDPFWDPYWGGNSFYGGNAWNSGWGWNMGMGFGNSWGNPYRGWGNNWGSPWGWNSWYPRNTVVIVNNGEAGRNVSYGKRPTRGTSAYTPNSVRTSRQTAINNNNNTLRPESGGRTNINRSATTNQRQEDYYNRSWRNSTQGTATRGTTGSGSNNSYNRSSSGYNQPSYNSGNSGSRTSSPSYSAPSRSSGSSGGGSTGSGSGGRTRGGR